MKSFYNSFSILCLFFFFGYYQNTHANNPEYEARRTAYINNATNNISRDGLVMQAYRGIPVDQTILNSSLGEIATRSTSDFAIVQLVRILMLTNGEYDSQILPVLEPIPFWLEANEDLREYWSENHMIMWSSSNWLLHEKYGFEMDSTLDKRLRHYLKLKKQYGFYEFFSSTYAGYTLSGLLNLADFSQDAEIKSLASDVAQLLLKEILKLTNNKGVFFPVAGRNYMSKYQSAYGQNHNNLIYLLTGMGQVERSSHSGGFLATSSIPVDDIINSWTPVLNTVYTVGHTLQNGINNINNTMSPKDKVIFQWSSGSYFHPDVAKSTFQQLNNLNLWNHFEFDEFRQFKDIPADLIPAIAEIGSAISKSSVLCNPTFAIFKNKSVTLSSLQDYWKGKNGYQQFPVVANAGTSAVFTISGKPTTDWEDRPSIHANIHLPYVKQTDNIALVMYRPEKTLALFGYTGEKLDVALYWENEKFDEIRETGNWILGREGEGYVAVRRNCTNFINGVRACDNPDAQSWVIMVGNADMYGSFDAFEQKLVQSHFEEKWYLNVPTLEWVYYSKIEVDGKTLEYAWNGNILSGPTRTLSAINSGKFGSDQISVYPNPANNLVNIDVSKLKEINALKIMNPLGQVVFSENNMMNNSIQTINTSNWSNGMYILELQTKDQIITQKFLIER